MSGKVIVWPEAGRAEVRRLEIPEPGPGEALVATRYTVLSAGTEKACLLAEPNTVQRFPQYPGYSGSGRVAAVGAGVEAVRPGDLVLADHKGHRSHFLAPADRLVRAEPEVSELDAAFVVLAAMALQGVRKARIELGETALVAGLGLLGLFAVQLARLSGAGRVFATDFDETRRKLAPALGAHEVYAPDAPDWVERLKARTRGRGVDVVVEVTGAAAALGQALDCVAPRGRVVLLGCSRRSDAPVDFYREVHKPGVVLIGAHNFVRPAVDSSPGFWTYEDDFRALLGLFGDGRLRAEPLVSRKASPEEAPAVYRQLTEEPAPPLGLVFDWTRDARG